MRNYIQLISGLLIVFTLQKADAQTPTWAVNPSDYEFSMTVTAVLNTDGVLSSDKQDKVGAFINGVCRGVASPSDFAAAEGNVIFLQVYSNSILGETVDFQFFDASTGAILNAMNTLPFQNDLNTGTIASPYIITSNLDPTDIALSPAEVMEGLPAGSYVGNFSVTDPDGAPGALNSYTLLSAASDNASFSIVGDTLKTAVVFDHDEKTTYIITVFANDGKGGSFQKEIHVQVTPDPGRFTASNYISPNGDGKNDVWMIKNYSVYKDYSIIIYNDAGIKVLDTVGYNNDWSGTFQGKDLPQGVYYYVVQSPDGQKKFRGSISVNR